MTRTALAALAGLVLTASTPGLAADVATVTSDEDLERLFREHARVVERDGGAIAGAGGDFLVAEAERSRFFCIGEPHNSHDVPEFVTALFARLQEEAGYRYLAIEQGPFVTERIAEAAATDGNDAVRKFAKKRRKALHFRTVEEVDMIADVARLSEGAIPGVWGLDRVLAPRELGDYLASAQAASDPEADFLRERAAWSAENLAMYKSKRVDPDGPSADQHREDGFKRGFEHFEQRASAADGAPPRVVFRFGHVHMGRLEGKRYRTLGSWLGARAEEAGTASFNVSIQFINRKGHYWSLTDYPDYAPLTPVGDPTRWVVVDLRPAREAVRAGTYRPSDKLLRMIFDFEAVLLMGGTSRGDKL